MRIISENVLILLPHCQNQCVIFETTVCHNLLVFLEQCRNQTVSPTNQCNTGMSRMTYAVLRLIT